MVPRKASQKLGARSGRRTALATLIALGVFCVLGTTPLILRALNLHILPVAPKSGYGVTLLPAPKAPLPVALPLVARAVDPAQPPAPPPAGDPAREAALVSAEDARIRVLLHAAVRIYHPEVLPVRGSLPTLVLTAVGRAYTANDLIKYGALVLLPHHAGLLIDNVFVSTNAKLSLGSSRLRVLYMDSATGGFASIVSWGGDLYFQGAPGQPLTIMGWDRSTKSVAVDRGYGRAYIREVGGKMTFTNVHVTSLGFWSGRTGGVAWTGVLGQPSGGGATNSTFTDDTYGAFVSRGQGVRFSRDLFEFNQLDGVHVHRYSVGTSVDRSSSARNGGNGFLVDRATQATTFRADVAQNNEGNGFLIDGRPLVSGASASGSAVAPGSGAVVRYSAALSNEKTGILIEGGAGTVLKADEVCATITGIAARYNATNTVITGNDVRCGPRSGLSVGPQAPGTIISGNTVSRARIAILVRSSGRITADNNVITGATVFGITARGQTSQVSGVGNVISGTGFRAVDARADASRPALSGTNSSGWIHHVKITFWSYLLYHPLAALWLSLFVLVLACYLWSRRRRLPSHPYPASTRWRPADDISAPDPATRDLELAFAAAAADPGPHAGARPATRPSVTADHGARSHSAPRAQEPPAYLTRPAPSPPDHAHSVPLTEPASAPWPAREQDPRPVRARHRAPTPGASWPTPTAGHQDLGSAWNGTPPPAREPAPAPPPHGHRHASPSGHPADLGTTAFPGLDARADAEDAITATRPLPPVLD